MSSFCRQTEEDSLPFMVHADRNRERIPLPAAMRADPYRDQAGARAQALWLTCWLAAYAPEASLPAAAEGLGGLPLLHWRTGPGRFPLGVLHGPTNLQTPRLEVPTPRALVSPAALLAMKRQRAAGVVLEYLPEAGKAEVEQALQQAGIGSMAMPQAAVPISDCRQSFEAFIERRSKRERQRSRRLLRLIDAADAPLVFSVLTGGAGLAAKIEECLTLEQASWKGRAGTAILDSAQDARFYRALAQELAAMGLLRMALLHDRAGQLAAFELCMVWDDRLIALKTSCSEEHLELSPGHVLALAHIRHCCADPAIALYDVTGNGLNPAPHLLRFADSLETLWRLILFAPGWRGQMLRQWWQARLRLRSVKRFWARLRR